MLKALWKSFVFLLLVCSLQTSNKACATNYKDDSACGLADGAGVWANLWNYPEGDLDSYCHQLTDNGINNLFIQTSRSNTEAIKYPDKLAKLIEACHRHQIRIIAWSFAELINPEQDAEKMIKAAQFTSPNGEHLDGIAPNLEKNLDPYRLEKYSKKLRSELGDNYPIIAVVYSPLNKCFEVKKISWPLLARYYSAIAPMIYWNSKYDKMDPYAYTQESIQKIRSLSGKSDLEIYAIGDGMGTKKESILKFMKACRDTEATGISLYPEQKITQEQLQTIAQHPYYLPKNNRFRMAAYREYIQTGSLSLPPKNDPSQLLNRKDFYKLIVRQLYPAFIASKTTINTSSYISYINYPTAQEAKEADGYQSFQILVSLGVLNIDLENVSLESILDTPLNSKEAMSTVRRLVEINNQKYLAKYKTKQNRLDKWFIPPALADNNIINTVNDIKQESNALNYVEASQLILQVSSFLRKQSVTAF